MVLKHAGRHAHPESRELRAAGARRSLLAAARASEDGDTPWRVKEDPLLLVYAATHSGYNVSTTAFVGSGEHEGARMEASTSVGRSVALRQPAYGEYTEYPEIEAQDDRPHQETARDELGRWAQWPSLLTLVLLEVAWLAALGYVFHRLLSPYFG